VREEIACRWAAATGLSVVFKVGARHGTTTWLWRLRGARWTRASDRRAMGKSEEADRWDPATEFFSSLKHF
jgi:hypothetical protein